MKRPTLRCGLSLLAATCLLSAPLAASMRADLAATSVHLEIESLYESVNLRVSGEGHFVEVQFGKEQALAFFPAEHGLPDGSYTFEAVANPARPDSRGEGEVQLGQRIAASGHFRLVGGVIADPGAIERVAADPVTEGLQGVSSRDQQIVDDLIVQGSICAGFDCVNGESFGFDTLRLKENNLRITAQDTSTSASFPSTDWQITFNETNNGGKNKFSIDDITGGRTPFTIEASAPSHSLYVEDGGRVGFGTATPTVDLHVVSGNTPTLRLEQDGSQGFTAQTWDVAGNEAGFFIRDATNGSKLSFRAFPNAPQNSLVIEQNTGDIGLGTISPSGDLTIFDGSSNVDVDLTTSSQSWRLRANSNNSELNFINNTSSTAVMRIHPEAQGNLVQVGGQQDQTGQADLVSIGGSLDVSGNIILAGTCAACDGVFTPDFELETIEEHAEFMWRNSYLPGVGATPDGPTRINVFEKTTGILQELEKAHIYIEQLNDTVQQQARLLEEMRARLAEIEDGSE